MTSPPKRIILDFEVRPLAGETYSLSLRERHFAKRRVSPLLASSTFSHRVDFLTDFSVDRLNTVTKNAADRFDQLQKLGRDLYQRLFTPKVEQILGHYKQNAEFVILCLRFAKQAKPLEVLPWETMHDGTEFIAAGANTTITRLPLGVKPQGKLPMIPRPLKLLGFFSSPLDLQDHERLNVEREQEILLEAINDPAGQGRISGDFEDEAKLEILERSLRDGYHILHFTGHGISPRHGGGLLLEDEYGNQLFASTGEVMRALKTGADTLRLVVISGCQTARTLHAESFHDLSRELLEHRVPAVIAMQFSITDDGGVKFAEVLYKEIAKGEGLERAVHVARRRLLDDKRFFIKNDALGIVLLTADGNCLRTDVTEVSVEKDEARQTYLGDRLDAPEQGFYGRRREYRKIRDALVHKNHRAVIIQGIGGVGKTALAAHVVNRLGSDFKAVMTFDCRRAALVPETILLTLHRYFATHGMARLQPLIGQTAAPERLAAEIAQMLSRWPLIIVFDGVEHQLNESREFINQDLRIFLTSLVTQTETGSRFIFTTRYSFDLDGKQFGNLQEVALVDLSRSEALMLMQKLPNLAQADYHYKVSVLEKFGGHPYTLVAVDRHCRYQPLAEALRDASSLESELREFLAIEFNYKRLSGEACELLDRLAAFRQPVPFQVAEWVLGENVGVTMEAALEMREMLPEELTVMNDEFIKERLGPFLLVHRQTRNIDGSIDELINWGLLTPHREAGELRALSIHSLVREFCRQQQGENWRAYLRDAALYYNNRTKLLSEYEKSPYDVEDEMEAFELLLEADEANQASLLLVEWAHILHRWGYGRDLETQCRRILDKLDNVETAVTRQIFSRQLIQRGAYEEALEQCHLSLRISEEVGFLPGVAVAVGIIATIHKNRGNYKSALHQYQLALKIFEEIDDRPNVARALQYIGTIHKCCGDYEAAMQQCQMALKMSEEINERSDVAAALHEMGDIHRIRRDYDKALQHYQLALTIEEEISDRLGIADLLHDIGIIHQYRGEYETALRHYQLSLDIHEEIGDRPAIADSLHQIGNIYELRHDYAAALHYYQLSLNIEKEIGDNAGAAISCNQIGKIHHYRGDHDTALQHYQLSLEIKEGIGDRAGVAKSRLNIGRVHRDRGNYEAALEQYQLSLKTSDQIGDRAGVAHSHDQIGIIHMDRDEYQAALHEFELSLEILEQIGDRATGARLLHQIGIIHQRCGNYEMALNQYQRSLKIFEDIGDREGTACAVGQIGWLFTKAGRHEEAFENLMSALPTLVEVESSKVGIVANNLKTLRGTWGAANFDAAWQQETESDVPEWFRL